MASLFEIGKTGVQAYRQALSVTGHNIANINTDGYNKNVIKIVQLVKIEICATLFLAGSKEITLSSK